MDHRVRINSEVDYQIIYFQKLRGLLYVLKSCF